MWCRHSARQLGIGEFGTSARERKACSAGHMPCHLGGKQDRHVIAAGGGADRRSAKNASAGMNQSREAHLAERSLHSPAGASPAETALPADEGYAICGAGNAVGIDVGVAVRFAAPELGRG
jgi:hypothetical protein